MANVSEAKGLYTFLFEENNINALGYLLELMYSELDNVEYYTNLHFEDVIKDGTVMGTEVQIDIEKLKDYTYNTGNLVGIEFSFTGAGRWAYGLNLENMLNWLFKDDNKVRKFFELSKSKVTIEVGYEDFEPGNQVLGEGGAKIILGKSLRDSSVEIFDFKQYNFNKENYEKLGFVDWDFMMGE